MEFGLDGSAPYGRPRCSISRRGRVQPSYAPFARRVDAAQTLREAPAREPVTEEEFQAILDEAVRARASWALRLWDERSQREKEPAIDEARRLVGLPQR